MTEGRPYSRVYWEVLDDTKFDAIRADMRHFGSWTLMLVVADMAYPAPAFVPPTVTKASLDALVTAELVDVLPARMFRLRGQKKERERRSEHGKKGADARWSGNATALPAQSQGNATPMLDETRRDETSKDKKRVDEQEQATARAGLPNLDHDAIRGLEDRTGEPWSRAGDKQLGEYDRLIGIHGLPAVLGAIDAVTDGKKMTARQVVWPAMKLLEPMASAPDTRAADMEQDRNKRAERIQAGVWARREEQFRFTGHWEPEWGPQPEKVAS